MNYVAQSRRPNPAAIFGALGVPAAFGALMIAGLAVTVVIDQDDKPLPVINVTTPPPPTPTPPPDQAKPEIPKSQPASSVITAPQSPLDLDNTPMPVSNPLPPTGPLPAGPTPGVGNGLGTGAGPLPTPSPTQTTPPPRLIDPIAAQPRGNPGSWITDRDYRSSWIRRGMSGQASFQLQISASGRVTGCSIIGSTGHSELDQATCSLIQRRARFEPARDNRGAVTAGTFLSSVNWRIPE